jgi:hypothetical protein
VGTGAVVGLTQLKGGLVSCAWLLKALQLPSTSRVRAKLQQRIQTLRTAITAENKISLQHGIAEDSSLLTSTAPLRVLRPKGGMLGHRNEIVFFVDGFLWQAVAGKAMCSARLALQVEQSLLHCSRITNTVDISASICLSEQHGDYVPSMQHTLET